MEIGLLEKPTIEGELQGTRMGSTDVIGPKEVTSMKCPVKQVEDLGLDSRPLALHLVGWVGFGSIPTQFKVPKDSLGSISTSSKQAQNHTINQSKSPSLVKRGVHQFTQKVLRRRKSAMAKGRISLALHRPSYSPPTQPVGEQISKVTDKDGITISDSMKARTVNDEKEVIKEL
ncbi:hypothetical protein Ancab_014971 [Ancistrocladus abbreviatus]